MYNRTVLSAVASSPSIIGSPSFIGPTVINRTQIEFYCDIRTNDIDQRARFNVTFLFTSEADDDVPVQMLTRDNPRATLHERYLAGRLNKVVRLSISQYHTCNLQYWKQEHNVNAKTNKKLRYREEHSASVVLSWCTL